MATTSPLRRRMIEDMSVRNLSPATQRSYVSAVSKFSRHFCETAGNRGSDAILVQFWNHFGHPAPTSLA